MKRAQEMREAVEQMVEDAERLAKEMCAGAWAWWVRAGPVCQCNPRESELCCAWSEMNVFVDVWHTYCTPRRALWQASLF